MSNNSDYRDLRIPYLEDEFRDVGKAFKLQPTFENDSISSADIGPFLSELRIKRSPEQISAYQKHWDLHFGGRVPLSETILIFKAVHERKKWFLTCAAHLDVNRNGFINAEDFKPLLEMTVVHDPTVAGLTFQEFVQEADVNQDGRVSIEECADWIEKHAPNAAS